MVVIYDGVCNLCNAGARFVIERDTADNVHFVSAQSATGRAFLRSRGVTMDQVLNRFVAVTADGQISSASSAALTVATRMDAPWPLLYVFL